MRRALRRDERRVSNLFWRYPRKHAESNLKRARRTDDSLGSRSLNPDWNRLSRVRIFKSQVADRAGGDAWHHARSARHVDRERRAAAHAGQLFGQRRRDRVGAHELPGRQRHHDPDDRMDLIALRTQALLPDLGRRIRRSLGALRRRAIARSDGALSLDTGRSGRGDGAVVAGDPDGDVPAQRTADGDGDVGDGADGRADHGADARRMDHRQLELALEFLHQPADRRRGVPDGVDLRSRPGVPASPPRQGRQDRLHRYHPARRRARPGPAGARSRAAGRLVQLAVGRLVHDFRNASASSDSPSTNCAHRSRFSISRFSGFRFSRCRCC